MDDIATEYYVLPGTWTILKRIGVEATECKLLGLERQADRISKLLGIERRTEPNWDAALATLKRTDPEFWDRSTLSGISRQGIKEHG